MSKVIIRIGLVSLLLALLLTACEEPPLQAVGQLESDRIELVAEFSEPIIAIQAMEGDALSVGSLVLSQDSSRIEIRMDEARANIRRIEAILAEQLSGPRTETIDASRASLHGAEIERAFRERELERLTGLRERNLTSIESVDTAEKLSQSALARLEFVQAQLAELEAGTRPEQIQQSNAMLQQAQAQLAGLELDKRRLAITAPVAAILDSLPFEVGERPRPGDVVAVLLAGTQPYARLYIPEEQRLRIRPGSQLRISIDGLDGVLLGTVRRIAAEASFTPYFALTERDRGRLSYVAEVTLPDMPTRLPDGIPVQAVFD